MKAALQTTSTPLCAFLAGLLLTCPVPLQSADLAITNRAGSRPSASGSIRQAAVAGLFYPKESRQLAKDLERYLAAAPSNGLQRVRALICPHAGYEYSGPVAARAYRQITGSSCSNVVILAASHYALFEGVSVPGTKAYETPLGTVPVWNRAAVLAKERPFVLEPKCLVQRPPWAAISSRPMPSQEEQTPETWEHSVEVQIPFLQHRLKEFQILPLVFGRANPLEVAKALAPLVDDGTLVVASTDLTHYHPYEEAKSLDHQTLRWISEMNVAALEKPAAESRACGRMPVITLLHLAKTKGWKAQLLDYKNSGDTAGDKSRVVGYGAVAFVDASGEKARESGSTLKAEAQFTESDRKFLLDVARRTLTQVTSGGSLPFLKAEDAPPACREQKGCFVTLTRSGDLRGCIGNIMPAGPLYEAVIENTRNAALRDARFLPVTSNEARGLHIEVSVLTAPKPLVFAGPDDLLTKLQPRRDGVVLRIADRGATFLPQVWDQLPNKTDFLEHLSAKAGCGPSAWRGKDVSVSIYQVEAFEEAK